MEIINNSNTVTEILPLPQLITKTPSSAIETGHLAYPNTNVQITNTNCYSDPDDTRLDSAHK